jgi:non-heme chloroperoxidase
MPDCLLPNGVTLAYDDQGDPASCPIVLIHGVSMSRRYFHKQLQPLGEQHRVLALDLRGHGASSKPEAGHTVPQYARDLKLFIETLGLDRPVLLGWSMGGFVAWDYIQQFGTSGIRALIVTDEAASDFKWDGFPHGFVDLPALRTLMTEVQDNRMELLESLVPQMFYRPQAQDDLDWMVAECARLPIGASSAIFFDQSLRDYRESVKQVDVPTLVCWGRQDALLPVSGAEDLVKRIPDAKLVIFDESGHGPFIEESDSFNQVVSEFVMSVET